MREATGEFEVKIQSQAAQQAPGATLGRSTLEKTFRGGLEGTGTGEMLTAVTDVKGSAAYVAVERVTGVLDGRRGAFALVHKGTMVRGAQSLTVEIVPDSGTGDLAGIAGSLAIEIRGGKHYYTLRYQLGDATR
jgi:hypothetical protein